jgi:hypothetical protein
MSEGTNGLRPTLPAGWEWSTLGELCDKVGGVTVDAKRRDDNLLQVPYLRVANVQRGSLDLSIWVSSEQMRRLQFRPSSARFVLEMALPLVSAPGGWRGLCVRLPIRHWADERLWKLLSILALPARRNSAVHSA